MVISYPHSFSDKLVKQDINKLIITGSALIPPSETRSMFFARVDTNGVLDLTFNNSGFECRKFAGYGADTMRDLEIMSNGKVMAMFHSSKLTAISMPASLAMVAFNGDGSTYLPFGFNGVKVDTLNQSLNERIKMQNSGQFLVAGRFGNSRKISIARYHADGTIDSSFATNGRSVSFRDDDNFLACALDTDINSKIYRTLSFSNSLNLFRYTANGFPDSSFGFLGLGYFPQNNLLSFHPCDVKVLPNNKPLVVGVKDTGGPAATRNRKVFCAVFTTNGSADSSFNQVGYRLIDMGYDSVICRGIELLPNGQFVGIGNTQAGYGKDIDLLAFRANADGSLDSTFGMNGLAVIDIDNNQFDAGRQIEIQSDGKILLIGDTRDSLGNANQFVARLSADGIPDIDFGSNGVFIYSVSQVHNEQSVSAKIVNGHQLIVGGNFVEDLFQTSEMFIAKILLGTMTGILDFGKINSTEVMLYPNPIRSHGSFEFELAKDENISIQISDVQGREVKRLVSSSSFAKGKHQLSFDLNESITAGTYLIVFSNSNSRQVIKFLKE
jgi:uncharacterized delta-60 repeat protein